MKRAIRNHFTILTSKNVPPAAVDYCAELWLQHPFDFKLVRRRVSKLGDYRYDPRDASHTITVNADLNPYQFLVTYVHEVAHRAVHQPSSRRKPHGSHWKAKFQELMLPLLNPDVFPDDILRPLAKHMKNPKASTAGDPTLQRVLSKYDDSSEESPILADLQAGEEFRFRKRLFRKIEKKRTRALCLDLENKKRYLIPLMAAIEPLNSH